MAIRDKTKVYINGRLIGFHKDAQELLKEIISKRRQGRINAHVNVGHHEDTNEIYINTDAGRVQRPLLVVDNGQPKLTEDHIRQVKEGKINWNDLVQKGLIEYLDSEEEDNALVAVSEEDLTKATTHMEIAPVGMLSAISGMVPYLEHNLAGRSLHGAKMFKQAQGIGAANYNLRTDTEGYLLYYPQKDLVKTKTMDLLSVQKRPQIQNFVVAIVPYYGFNSVDALAINQGSIDRGLGRSTYFRTYEAEEIRYPGGQLDKFEVPTEETEGFMGEDAYKNLGEDGLVELERFISSKDVIVGRTSPPRFLEEVSEFGIAQEKRRESSVSVRKGKPGVVDKVIVTEGEGGNKLAKIKIRTPMIPEMGDKFSSRHGQKGVVGLVVPEEDMPFTNTGMRPDLIMNPHAIPSRMTVGHLLEMLGGKAASLTGKEVDGTPFDNTPEKDLRKVLLEHGFRPDGKETFYDGITGQKLEGEIFTGVAAYRRLFHMVSHKLQARSRGPVQILTRQPTEGKEKEGGLRFGEMEGETLVGHGAAMLLQEKFIEDSDKTNELVCEKCGVIAVNDHIRNRKYCPICQSSKVYSVEMAYGFKLLLDELKALGVMPKLLISDKV